jgi:ACR3 family arsenite transporter
MVFVRSNLAEGEPRFTLSQVVLNDAIPVSPSRRSWPCLSAITVPWATPMLSVVLYIIAPLIVAQVLGRRLLAAGEQSALDRLPGMLRLVSLLASLAPPLLLFGFHGARIIA